MPEQAGFTLYFGMEAFYDSGEVSEGSNTHGEGEHTKKVKKPETSTEHDSHEAGLSSLAQQMQQQARDKVKQRSASEREADNKSLRQLETETAVNSKTAKAKDEESLKTLMRCQKRIDKHKKSLATPPQDSSGPSGRHFTGMNGTPFSFETSNDTPTDFLTLYEAETGNEFEIFLSQECVERSGKKPKKTKEPRASFNPMLDSDSSSSSSSIPPTTTGGLLNDEETRAKLDSFYYLCETLKRKDKLDEEKLLDQQRAVAREIAEAMDTPVTSPTSAIKHLPRGNQESKDGSKGKGGNASSSRGRAHEKDGKDKKVAEAEEHGEEDDEDGWELV